MEWLLVGVGWGFLNISILFSGFIPDEQFTSMIFVLALISVDEEDEISCMLAASWWRCTRHRFDAVFGWWVPSTFVGNGHSRNLRFLFVLPFVGVVVDEGVARVCFGCLLAMDGVSWTARRFFLEDRAIEVLWRCLSDYVVVVDVVVDGAGKAKCNENVRIVFFGSCFVVYCNEVCSWMWC